MDIIEVMEVMAMVQEAHTPTPAQVKRQGLEFFLSFFAAPRELIFAPSKTI